jgi:hypothetical protein
LSLAVPMVRARRAGPNSSTIPRHRKGSSDWWIEPPRRFILVLSRRHAHPHGPRHVRSTCMPSLGALNGVRTGRTSRPGDMPQSREEHRGRWGGVIGKRQKYALLA